MNKYNLLFAFLMVFSLTTLQSCDLIGDILEAGIWTGIIIVVAVVLLIVWLISKMRRRL